MTTFLLIVLPLAGVITAIYEIYLLRRGRGSRQALVSGVLMYGGLTVATVAGTRADGDTFQKAAAIVGIGSLFWHTTVTRQRRQPTVDRRTA